MVKSTGMPSTICGTCRWEYVNLNPRQRAEIRAERGPRPSLVPHRPIRQSKWKRRVDKAKATASAPTKKLYIGKTKGARPPI